MEDIFSYDSYDDDPLETFGSIPVDYQLSFECVPLSHCKQPKTPFPTIFNNHYSIFESENIIYLPDRKHIQQRQLLIVYVVGAELSQEEAFWQLHHYVENVTHVEFNGHIGSDNSVFQILNVLKNVKHVTFNFGAHQLQFFSQFYRLGRKFKDVQSLTFNMDLKVYETYARDENKRMVTLMDTLMSNFLGHAAQKCFPNLKKLSILAPVSDQNYECALQMLISSERLCLGSKVTVDCFDRNAKIVSSSEV